MDFQVDLLRQAIKASISQRTIPLTPISIGADKIGIDELTLGSSSGTDKGPIMTINNRENWTVGLLPNRMCETRDVILS